MRRYLVVVMLAAACGKVQNDKPDAFVPPADAPAVASIMVTGQMTIGKLSPPVQLTATGTYADSTTKDITAEATWSSSNPTVATVSGGLVTPVAVGATTITAALDGKNGILNLTVAPPTLVVAYFTGNSIGFVPSDSNGTTARCT